MQQQQNNTNAVANIPAYAGHFTPQHFQSLMLPEADRRIALDMNWLSIQARENPELQAADFVDFINQCQLTGADPRRKQAHLVTFKKKIKVYDPQQNKQVDQWVLKANTIFSYHFFITKAQETGEMQGLKIEDGIGKYANPNTKMITDENFCKVTVTRKGCPYEFTAWYPEFVKTKKDYTSGEITITEMWLKMPKMMLQKCAIANALRLAFSEALVGMYISEEMNGEESMVPSKDVGPVNTPPATPPQAPQQAKAAAPVQPPPQQAPPPDRGPEPVDESDNEHGDVIDASYTEVQEQPAFDMSNPPPLTPAKEEKKPAAKPRAVLPRTKQLLYSKMQYAAGKGVLNLDAGIAKLKTVDLMEDVAQTIIQQLDQGDASWFTNG